MTATPGYLELASMFGQLARSSRQPVINVANARHRGTSASGWVWTHVPMGCPAWTRGLGDLLWCPPIDHLRDTPSPVELGSPLVGSVRDDDAGDLASLGVNHRSVVSRSPPPLGRSFQTWTVFLPNVGSPTSVARPCSWSAPATISDADAEPPSTRTTTGMSLVWSEPAAGRHSLDVLARLDGEEQLAGRDELRRDALRGDDEAAGVAAQVEDEVGGALRRAGDEIASRKRSGARSVNDVRRR